MTPNPSNIRDLLEEIETRLQSVKNNAWGDYDNFPEYKDHDIQALNDLKRNIITPPKYSKGRIQAQCLHIAAAMALTKTSLHFLQTGVSINSTDPCGYTPLILASSKNAFMIVCELLKRGADVKHKANDDGVTALHMASGPESTQLLLSAGANPNTYDLEKNTPLHWIAGNAGEQALHSAQLLLESGAKVNTPNRAGETPLFRSAWTDVTPEMTKLLIESGADINHTTPTGETPLWAAIFSGNLPVIRILLEHGADPSAQLDDGLTPLQFALEQAMDEEFIQCLADYGAQG